MEQDDDTCGTYRRESGRLERVKRDGRVEEDIVSNGLLCAPCIPTDAARVEVVANSAAVSSLSAFDGTSVSSLGHGNGGGWFQLTFLSKARLKIWQRRREEESELVRIIRN